VQIIQFREPVESSIVPLLAGIAGNTILVVDIQQKISWSGNVWKNAPRAAFWFDFEEERGELG
jgi:hypothetical protein